MRRGQDPSVGHGQDPLDDLLKLPAAERAELAIALLDSLGNASDVLPLTEDPKTELDRCVADHDADPSTAVSWEELRHQLRQVQVPRRIVGPSSSRWCVTEIADY